MPPTNSGQALVAATRRESITDEAISGKSRDHGALGDERRASGGTRAEDLHPV